MKNTKLFSQMAILGVGLAAGAVLAQGQEGEIINSSKMLRAVGSTIGYSFLGIVMSIVGFKLFDWTTPFHLEKEIVQERNMAVALVCAAMILGISLIVSLTILG